MQLQPKERHNMNSTAQTTQAANPALSAEDQAALAQFGTPEVREALAANPCLVDTQQHYLATTGSIEVRCKLAGNPSLTPTVQALLFSDRSNTVVAFLAANPVLESVHMYKLARSESVEILASLVINSSLPQDLLSVFLKTFAPADRDQIRVRSRLARNPALSEAQQLQLLDEDKRQVLESLAQNPSLNENLQARLAETGSSTVLCSLAGNPALAEAQQALLALRSDYDVRLELLKNPQLVPEVKAMVIASFSQTDLENAQRRATYANEEWCRLQKESSQASEKFHQSAMLGDIPIFNSAAKKERLEREADRASECAKAAASAHFHSTAQARAISEILSQKGVKITPTIFSGAVPSFLRSQAS